MDEREKKLVKEHLRVFEVLRTRKELWLDIWQSISDYILPRLTSLKTIQEPKPQKYGLKMYNSTAVNALQLAVDGTLGYTAPPSSVWMQMQPVQKRVLDIPGVRAFYQDTTEAQHSVLNRSNFYDEMVPILEHGFALGTAGMFVDEDEERGLPIYVALDPKDLYIAENRYGKVDTFYMRKWMYGRNILDKFEEFFVKAENAELKRMLEKEAHKPFEILHVHEPRSEYDRMRIDSKNMPWASVWILKDKQVLLAEKGYEFQRAVCWRFRKRPGEEYGTSSGWDALVDTIRINQASRTLLDAAHMAVRPPITYPAELRDLIEIEPNGMTPYIDPTRKAEVINVLGSYPIGRDREEALEQAIRQHFHVDFFLMLSQSETQKTAYEVSQLLGEKAAVMGTKIGRIESELYDPTLEITYNIEYRAGRMPQAPDAVLELAPEYRFDYVGPLAQLQKQHYGQQARNQVLAQIAPFAQIEEFRPALDYVSADDWVKQILHDSGVDTDVVRDDEEVRKMRAAREQQQAGMASAEQLKALMEAAQKGSQRPEPGSPAEQLIQGMGGGGG